MREYRVHLLNEAADLDAIETVWCGDDLEAFERAMTRRDGFHRLEVWQVDRLVFRMMPDGAAPLLDW